MVRYSEESDSLTITSSSGRNKPTGLAGLACIHCCGSRNTNKSLESDSHSFQNLSEDASIFPQDRRALAKEVKTNIYQHMLNCKQCPPKTKQELQQRLLEQQQLLSTTALSSSSPSPSLESEDDDEQRRSNQRGKKPTISKAERLYFKNLWYQMGHKDMQQEQRHVARPP